MRPRAGDWLIFPAAAAADEVAEDSRIESSELSVSLVNSSEGLVGVGIGKKLSGLGSDAERSHVTT